MRGDAMVLEWCDRVLANVFMFVHVRREVVDER